MIPIDTNSLIVLIVGLLNPSLIKKHKRTSLYSKEDFYLLVAKIQNFDNLEVLPNVWTEVDNLLHNFKGEYKNNYLLRISEIIKSSSELYIKSETIINENAFYKLGLTDSLLLKQAVDRKQLITSDSALADFAKSYGVDVFDLVEIRNSRFK